MRWPFRDKQAQRWTPRQIRQCMEAVFDHLRYGDEKQRRRLPTKEQQQVLVDEAIAKFAGRLGNAQLVVSGYDGEPVEPAALVKWVEEKLTDLLIRLLDDPAWRESLKVAETPRKGCRQCGDEIERDGRCPVCQPTIEDIIEAARMSNRGRQT